MIILCTEYWSSVLQNALGCTLGSFVAIGGAFLIYKLTNIDHQKELSEQSRVESEEALKYFHEVIDQILKSSKQQNENIKKFADDITVEPLKVPTLKYIALFDFKRIAESHALDKLFLAYTRQFSSESVVKEFREIISEVEFLYMQFLEIRPHAERGMNFDHERKIQVSQIYREAYSVLGQCMIRIDFDNPDPVGKRFMDIVENHAHNFTDTADISFYQQYFFAPLNAFMTELLEHPVNRIPLFIQLAELTRDGIQVFQSIPKHNNQLADEFDEIHGATAEVIEKLETVSDQLLRWGAKH